MPQMRGDQFIFTGMGARVIASNVAYFYDKHGRKFDTIYEATSLNDIDDVRVRGRKQFVDAPINQCTLIVASNN